MTGRDVTIACHHSPSSSKNLPVAARSGNRAGRVLARLVNPTVELPELHYFLEGALMGKRYWLMKSEPSAYSIDDLKRDKSTLWEGVRNYQARNFMMKEMKVGDEALFYHSSAEPPGAVGIAEVSGPAEPDPTQFDASDSHYDPKATPASP